MQFTTLSALVAFAFALGTEAAAFASSSEGFASTVTFAASSIVASASDHHGHGASSSFIGFPTTTPTASIGFPTTAAPSSVPTFVPGDGSGAFICFPVADGFAVPGVNGTVIFPNSAAPTGTAFPSSAPTTVVVSAFPTGSGTAITSAFFPSGSDAASSAFATGSAAASSAFATTSAF